MKRKPYIRFLRIYEGLLPHGVYDERRTRPFDPAEHARNVAANQAEIAKEDARVAALKAAGVAPCPCCGEYHETT